MLIRSANSPDGATGLHPAEGILEQVSRHIDRTHPVPLYYQIASAIQWEIGVGRFEIGATLPPLRQAAEALQVNYHTVRAAYEELARRGVIATRRGAGTVVLRGGPSATAERPAAIAHGQDAEPVVAVVECNRTQAEEIARQVARSWRVTAIPWLLGYAAELPTGNVVTTSFHAHELEQRWPERINDIRVAALRLRPAMRIAVEQVMRECSCQRVMVVEQDPATGAAIAADISRLLSLSIKDVEVFTRPIDGRLAEANPATVVLVAPRLWDGCPWVVRVHPRVLEVRYEMDPDDIERIGDECRWVRR